MAGGEHGRRQSGAARLSRRAFAACGGAAAAAAAAVLTLTGRVPTARAEPAQAGPRTGDLIGEISYHVTKPGETLLDIGRARNLGVPEISAVNPGVDPWVPG